MSSLNITTLRQQYHFYSLRELNKAYGILKEIYYEEIYYEKEQVFGGEYTYYDISMYLKGSWISEIWDEKDLYVFSILDENRDEIVFGTYTQIVNELKLERTRRCSGVLILTSFKAKEPKVVSDSEKIKKLETDISEIKELLKKR